MKPFVLISSRPEDVLSLAEYNSFLQHCKLRPDQLQHIRVDLAPLPSLDLDSLSGILVGGSPFNSSTPQNEKPETQVRIEAEMNALLDEVVPRDFPFFGACYGVGTLGIHQGGTVDTTFGETVSAPSIALTEAGQKDPIAQGVSGIFHAFVAHTEAIHVLPDSATLLATSGPCPVQMFRVGQNMYATQFHPELDQAALSQRVLAYDGHGYYPAGAGAETLKLIKDSDVSASHLLLENFARRYARD